METFTVINVVQENAPLDRGEVDENYIQLKILLHKYIGSRPSPESAIRWDSQTVEGGSIIWVDFPRIKQVASPYRSMCVTTFQDFLATTNVPEDKHALAIQKLFEAIDAAVSPDLPINVVICNVTLHDGTTVPATRVPIEGLERVRVDALEMEDGETCAICWLAYARGEHPVSQLPCSHYFHEHCIVQWLQINRVCPMCRFVMPNQPSQPSA
ncbi:PREDICTED: uncharacterized protein LOC101311507 [Fragaria vesca subsp. vesca]|uniref:uncharacterized protein LOC101311507 n=1 Tax=Fragaria vesca subsp. vesca TaxID=101020 RepID=UPI0002C34006|nr:PREDICTED: uncharacterized protein LOC101311507 [Fragaria vesca subsp. vesca]